MSNFIEGIAVSGDQVAGLKSKHFVVLKAPQYKDFPSLDDPENKERKLVMSVEIEGGAQLDYIPNKTSQKMMVSLFGYDMDKWIGQKFQWEVLKQKAFGKEVNVLYVIDPNAK